MVRNERSVCVVEVNIKPQTNYIYLLSHRVSKLWNNLCSRRLGLPSGPVSALVSAKEHHPIWSYFLCLVFPADPDVDIGTLDIAVNAVATAVKDFFFKRLPPILGPEQMSELEAISSELNNDVNVPRGKVSMGACTMIMLINHKAYSATLLKCAWCSNVSARWSYPRASLRIVKVVCRGQS